ncbi:MAG: hypothetical protein HY602_00110 [Parcubacteria group bacterium]|nr:hypothetical protein [Parcubacteria group bacterium]
MKVYLWIIFIVCHCVLFPLVLHSQEEPKSSAVYLLAVSIERYQDKRIPTLEGFHHNLEMIVNYLRDSVNGLDIPNANIIILKDESATQASILHHCRQILAHDAKDTTVIIFLNMHGGTLPIISPWLLPFFQHLDSFTHFFAPYDIDSELIQNIIPMSAIVEMVLDNIKNQTVILLVQTCYSGYCTEAFLKSANPRKSQTAVIASSGSLWPSLYIRWIGGLYGLALIKALEGQADSNDDGAVTLEEAAAYVNSRVLFLSFTIQNPQVYLPEPLKKMIIRRNVKKIDWLKELKDRLQRLLRTREE